MELFWAHEAFEEVYKHLEAGKISRDRLADVLTRLMIASPARPPQTEIAHGRLLPRVAQGRIMPSLPALSADSVSRAVTALTSMKLITQHKAKADRPGRPYTPLQLGSNRWAMVGVKIGHRQGHVCEFNVLVTGLDGIPLELPPLYQTEDKPYFVEPDADEDLIESLARVIEDMCDLPAVRHRYILGIGVEVAGHVFEGEVIDSSLSGIMPDLGPRLSRRLSGLVDRLNRLTGRNHPLPVVVDNDVNVLAVLETYDPRSPEQDLAVIAVFEDGIGSALIVNGNVYRGGHGMAGEIGHLHIPIETRGLDDTREHPASSPRDPVDRLPGFFDLCPCKRTSGHLDCYATPERIRGQLGGRAFTELAASPAESENALTMEGLVFKRAGEALGLAIATLMNLLNPSRVLIFLPPALEKPQPGSAAEQYRNQVSVMTVAHAFSDASTYTIMQFEPLNDANRRFFGAKAAAVRVLDAFLQHAKRRCKCYAPKPRYESDVPLLDDDSDGSINLAQLEGL